MGFPGKFTPNLLFNQFAETFVYLFVPQMLDLLAKFDVHQGAVRAIRFLDPFPALITSGTGGKMCIW